MIAVWFLPVWLLAHVFVVIWLLKWLKACSPVFNRKTVKIPIIAVYFFCTLSMYIAALFSQGKVEKFFRVIGYYWYGISVYIALVLIVAFLIRFIVRHSKLKKKGWVSNKKTFVITGAFCVAVVMIICVAGHYNATKLRTTNYEVKIEKECSLPELNIVLLADQHLGYNIGAEMMEQMVEKVNACDPDLVLIGGDIFDNCYANIEEPEKIEEILRQIRSKYGVYAVLGNHDCEEQIVGGFTFKSDKKKTASDGMYEFVEKSNFKLLCDEPVLIADSFYLYGRPDEERPGKYVEDERLTPEELMKTMDAEKPVIVLEHEPKELGELAQAGIDLHLAGHTHDGQMFPMNIGTAIMWENSYGLLEKENMTSIVTSGVGLYGPYIRVGTIPEICNIHVTFK